VNVADRPYFQRTLAENRFQVGEFAQGRISGQNSVHLATPLRDEAGQAVAVIVLALSLDWLLRELQSAPLPTGSSATITDRDGVILPRTLEPERFVGQRVRGSTLALVTAPTPGIVDNTAMDGVRRIAAYLPVTEPPIGLFMAVGLEVSSAVGAALDADRWAAMMIIGSLLLTFVLAIILFHAAVERPVRRLLATVRAWESQNWAARVGRLGAGREFRRLGDAFDAMADTVAAREAARLRAQTRMQAVVRVAPQIVLTADRHGQVDWTNEYWREITGLDMAQSRGDGWLDAIHPDDREASAAAWRNATAAAGADTFSREMRVCHDARKEWRWFLFTGAPIRDAGGQPLAWTAVGLDFHERRAAQAAVAETAARLRATYASAPVGLCLLDQELRFVAINDMLAETNGQPAAAHIGRTLEEMAAHVADDVRDAMRHVLATGQPIEALEVDGHAAGGARAWLCSYFPVFGAAGEVTGVSGAIIDITARKRIEASERMLSREVDHRAQNVLSVVRGLVRLSAADAADDVPALVEVLEGRIAALSRAHNVLSREHWVSADLAEIIDQELASHNSRVTIDGPSLRLTAEAAQPLTLVLHELATNAAKYGALSTPEGRLALRWAVRDGGVVLDWVERGGPPIAGAPERTGLGSALIDANVQSQLAGHLERRWDMAGLHCVLTMGAEAFTGGLAAPPVAPATPTFCQGLAGRRVLIADDRPARAEMLRAALQAAGCDVHGPAGDLMSALALLDATGTMDAAVLSATLQGVSVQLLTEALGRRAAVVLHLVRERGVLPGIDLAAQMPEPVTADGLRAALAAA
jgi:PAS domain S-box-containing protein